MATFVLIPGSLHGGWWFEPLARELRARGHEAYAVTLTGLGARSHLLGASVNLETHIQDVVGLLESEQIEDAVLVAHSYAGMVATAVADRARERVEALLYVDAFVPRDGQSQWELMNDAWRERVLGGTGENGYAIVPRHPSLDPRCTPHPLATYLQRIRLTGAEQTVPRREYVYLTGDGDGLFTPTFERLSADPAWRVHTLPSGHDIMRDAPDDLLKLALAMAE